MFWGLLLTMCFSRFNIGSSVVFLPKVQQTNGVSVASFVSMSIVENALLNSNDILLSMSASHTSQCMKKCSEITNCTSFNVLPKTAASENPYECQFLPLNKYADGSLLQSSPGWMHVSIMSIPCERSPCKNNGTCKPLYAQDGFQCVCNSNSTGDLCQYTVLTGIATQRQTSDYYPQYESPASFALDGNPNKGACSYASFLSGLIWWRVDLGKVAYIDRIAVYSSVVNNSLADFIVTIGNNPTDPQSNQACLPMFSKSVQITCLNKHYRGRYVFVYKTLTLPSVLSICEIKIYGSYTL